MDKDETKKLKTELADTYDKWVERIKGVKALRKRVKEVEEKLEKNKRYTEVLQGKYQKRHEDRNKLREKLRQIEWEHENAIKELEKRLRDEYEQKLKFAKRVRDEMIICDKCEALAAERDRLREVARLYCWHHVDCPSHYEGGEICTCGYGENLEAALKEGEGENREN